MKRLIRNELRCVSEITIYTTPFGNVRRTFNYVEDGPDTVEFAILVHPSATIVELVHNAQAACEEALASAEALRLHLARPV